MIGSSTTTTHGLLVPLCGHEISGWLRGWNNLLTGAAAAGEAAGKWVFSPPSRASLLSTAIGSAAPASSSCSSLLRHYYPILRLRPWRAADICRRFIIPSKATTRCCRRSSSFDRLSNNIIPPEMKRVPKKLWDDRLSRALSSVARCGCIVCAAIILLCSSCTTTTTTTTCEIPEYQSFDFFCREDRSWVVQHRVELLVLSIDMWTSTRLKNYEVLMKR